MENEPLGLLMNFLAGGTMVVLAFSVIKTLRIGEISHGETKKRRYQAFLRVNNGREEEK